MGMGIYEPGEDHLPFAVNLNDSFAIFTDPRIAQSIFTTAHRNNFPAKAEHGGVFDYAEIVKFRSAAGA
ncbi:MAG: hypothetical protein NVS1B11_26520 [Terriglobales bacterium]